MRSQLSDAPTQPNDKPMLHYHEDFCASLDHMLSSPWMFEDQWVCKDGDWIHPQGGKGAGGMAHGEASSSSPSGSSSRGGGVREQIAGRRPSQPPPAPSSLVGQHTTTRGTPV